MTFFGFSFWTLVGGDVDRGDGRSASRGRAGYFMGL